MRSLAIPGNHLEHEPARLGKAQPNFTMKCTKRPLRPNRHDCTSEANSSSKTISTSASLGPSRLRVFSLVVDLARDIQ